MSFRHVAVPLGAAFCLVLFTATSVLAQSERGTISGTVHDASGAVVPGAKVSVTATATNTTQVYTTTDSGDFTAPSMAVGQYDIRFEKTGFRTAELRGVTVNAATSVRADANLEIGSAATTVEVQATGVQLHTEDAKSSTTISSAFLLEASSAQRFAKFSGVISNAPDKVFRAE